MGKSDHDTIWYLYFCSIYIIANGSVLRIFRGQVQFCTSTDIEEYFKYNKCNILRIFLHKNSLQKVFTLIRRYSSSWTSLLLGEKEKEILNTVQILCIISPLCLKKDLTICHQTCFNLGGKFSFCTLETLLWMKTLSIC